jgi:type VI secretion system protein ImpL
MNRFWNFLFNPRVLAVLGILALAAFLFIGARELQLALTYAGIALAVALLLFGIVWVVRKVRAVRAAKRLEAAIEDDAEQTLRIRPADRAPAEAVRDRLLAAIKTLRTSRLGQLTGNAALYELPWYVVIGNPAAGKSSAIIKSGLNFPLAADGSKLEAAVVQGIGGTRNCDWFMTSEGILLDTAGRYSVHEEDHVEWLGFLGLLKKHRPLAPINGVLVAVSVAELTQGKPEAAIQLAKRLRQRVQELTEKLEVFAPLYLVFTKTDLVAGFAEFFEDFDRAERDRIWGATLPFEAEKSALGTGPVRIDAVAAFDRHFDELRDGLKEIAVARMSLQRGQALPPGLLTFPLEFAAAKPALRAFIATLFEENPYQFRPVFRGFYFTSAVQEGSANSKASEEVARQFALGARRERTTARVVAANGFFLKDLFQRVIFADKQLVRQYASRNKRRLRIAAFAASVSVLALALAGWSWTYLGNRQLMQDVQADLAKAAKLQAERVDLGARMEALEVLQYRIEQLAAWQQRRPWGLGLGLYQGETIEAKLRQEYYAGLKQVMLQPVAKAIEGYLGEVNTHAAQLQPLTRPPESGAPGLATTRIAAGGQPLVQPVATGVTGATDGRWSFQAAGAPSLQPAVAQAQAAQSHVDQAAVPAAAAAGMAAPTSRYADASPTDVEDAYNALKTYLMLAERQRMEPSHLKDQVARFWRGWLETQRGSMPAEQMKRKAEGMISFAMAQLQDPAFPTLDSNFTLVDNTRTQLKRVMRGMPARERVYAEVKARASTRFAQVTVANIVGEAGRGTVAGSAVVAGTFTREAWDGYIEKAFKDAAQGELQSTDWVLQTAARDDLTLEGSPDQIRKSLTELYKAEYVREWQRFVQGIAVAEFDSFAAAVMHMNKLGDAGESPIRKVLATLNDQTSWDNPTILNDRLAKVQTGMVEWFKQSILRQAPSRVEVKVDVSGADGGVPMGPIGREFAALHKLMAPRQGAGPLFDDYLKALGGVRTRFNQIAAQGDPGPAARKLMASTLEGSQSELVDAVRLVEEQMLAGMTDSARAALRPLLLRPLMQSFSVLVGPAETELNRAWVAQVHEPFQRGLATKYPFDANSRMEAVPQEIAKVFGPQGAVARFADEALGPLVVRRGDSIAPRTWLDMSVRLRPEFVAQFGAWVAPLDGAAGGAGGAAAGTGGAAAPAAAQTSFQILPHGAPGLAEYTVEIDGQVLRYRNGAAVWTPFVWPGTGQPGARIAGVTMDGRSIELLNVPGRFGLQRMFETAERRKLADGSNELSWAQGPHAVTIQLRVISQPGPSAAAAAAPAGGTGLRGLRLPPVVAGLDQAMAAAPSANAANAMRGLR